MTPRSAPRRPARRPPPRPAPPSTPPPSPPRRRSPSPRTARLLPSLPPKQPQQNNRRRESSGGKFGGGEREREDDSWRGPNRSRVLLDGTPGFSAAAAAAAASSSAAAGGALGPRHKRPWTFFRGGLHSRGEVKPHRPQIHRQAIGASDGALPATSASSSARKSLLCTAAASAG